MDFSQLPYEVQFNYLLGLPYQSIVQYCRTNPAANLICTDAGFWNRKALRDFGFPGFITGDDPVLQYAHLEEAYRADPETLLPYLIETGNLDAMARVLQRINLFYEGPLQRGDLIHMKSQLLTAGHYAYRKKSKEALQLILEN